MQPKYGSTSLCDQNCGVQPADRQTDTQADTGTDKSLKTEGPKILSHDIFYFRTVIIGGPKTDYSFRDIHVAQNVKIMIITE